jgi:hypothetical protein
MDNHDEAFPYPTLLVHADDGLAPTTDIAPTLHPSTTYRYPINEADWHPVQDGERENPREPVYSRLSYSTTERVEKVLGELMGGNILTSSDAYIEVTLSRMDRGSLPFMPFSSTSIPRRSVFQRKQDIMAQKALQISSKD